MSTHIKPPHCTRTYRTDGVELQEAEGEISNVTKIEGFQFRRVIFELGLTVLCPRTNFVLPRTMDRQLSRKSNASIFLIVTFQICYVPQKYL